MKEITIERGNVTNRTRGETNVVIQNQIEGEKKQHNFRSIWIMVRNDLSCYLRGRRLPLPPPSKAGGPLWTLALAGVELCLPAYTQGLCGIHTLSLEVEVYTCYLRGGGLLWTLALAEVELAPLLTSRDCVCLTLSKLLYVSYLRCKDQVRSWGLLCTP